MAVINKLKKAEQVIARKKENEGNTVPTTDNGDIKRKMRKRGPRQKKRRPVKGNKASAILATKNEDIVNPTQVTGAVRALLLYIEKAADANSLLFGDEPQPILMHVAAMRVPKCPSWRLRFKLPNPVITNTSDVCIFVHNLTKRYSKNLDRTVNYYKELFEKEGISQISQIIPLKQMKTEYSQYEQKRRLCQQVDVFLSDVRISSKVALHFGKFLKCSVKTPIPVRIHGDNLKEEIDKALSRTTMNIHGKGNSFIVQVGHTKQPIEHIVQNIGSVTTGLSREFPGGWENVSALYIKTTNSLSVPVFVSSKSPNDVPVPVVKPKRPKKIVPVEGELSTRVGFSAKVYAAGRVMLKKQKPQDSDIEWSDEDWETEWRNFENKVFSKSQTSESHLEEKPVKKAGKKSSKDELKLEIKDEDEIEDDIVGAEESYLEQWKRKRDEDNEEKKGDVTREESAEPRRKKVKYTVGEMCLGNFGNKNTTRTARKSNSGGMVHSAFQEVKSKISRKKLAKKQNVAKQNKSVICSNKSSKNQTNRNVKGKGKGKSAK